jgi:hypothetical protein
VKVAHGLFLSNVEGPPGWGFLKIEQELVKTLEAM